MSFNIRFSFFPVDFLFVLHSELLFCPCALLLCACEYLFILLLYIFLAMREKKKRRTLSTKKMVCWLVNLFFVFTWFANIVMWYPCHLTLTHIETILAQIHTNWLTQIAMLSILHFSSFILYKHAAAFFSSYFGLLKINMQHEFCDKTFRLRNNGHF